MRKSALLFGLILALFLSFSMASALNNCQSSQTIMKLSATGNAHVETSSSSLYSLRVCYDEIFGVNYTLSSPQTCTASNIVAKLSQSTNAHIEGPAGTAFPVSLCYGDLSCTLRSGACQLNEAQIVSLAQTTNSHASLTNAFPYKLCCSSAFALANSNNTNLSSGTGLMSFVVNSPLTGGVYNNSVILSVTSQNASSVLYNFGASNFSYISPVNLSFVNGSYVLNVYAINATTMLAQSISFTILNTSLSSNSTNTTNNTNSTNVTSNGTGIMSFTVNSPTPNTNYSSSVLVNITSQNASSVLYNFGTGNFTYTSPVTLSLTNGSYVFTVYVSNSTTLFQQSLLFNLVNSTVSSNPTNNTNGSSGGNNGNGGSSGSGGGSGGSSKEVKSGTTSATQKLTEQYSSGDEPIVLGKPQPTSKSTINVTLLQSGLIILILLLFIVIAQSLINKHFQSRNKRV
ncbi:MAG TPA: hypothetical protein VHA12_02825 [Candidatus Nanoarchaeia archaeon]|nr:hypothetical protein [Candidatus Nanoarchaeia archaeon]